MKLEDAIKQPRFKSEVEKLSVNLLYTGSWYNAISLKTLKPFGISPQQYNILRILRGQYPKPATIQLIKERMLDEMSNVSRLVEKLRAKGLLERHTCPDDRRAVDVVITRQGLDLLTEIAPVLTKANSVLGALNETEARQLNALLDKLRG